VAQLTGRDFREDEAIVPFAAGLLQVFELSGEAVGREGGPGSGFGKIAREFGPLANLM
jgi:hypothetical protein